MLVACSIKNRRLETEPGQRKIHAREQAHQCGSEGILEPKAFDEVRVEYSVVIRALRDAPRSAVGG